MSIQISQQAETCQAMTHAGVFHADEVLAAAILSHCGVRSVLRAYTVPESLAAGAVVFDVGGGAYDHHMSGGNGSRENGVPYSSCGLIWRDYGLRACIGVLGEGSCAVPEEVWASVDAGLIQLVDAADNGVGERYDAGFTAMIAEFNPPWNSRASADEAFLAAVEFADTVLINRIRSVGAVSEAKTLVEQALEKTEGPILVLDRYMTWRDALASFGARGERILFVVYPAIRGGFNCQCVPPPGEPFAQKLPLPESWRGLSREELRKLTGVSTAIFCHPGGFLCGAETCEDAVRLAKLVIKEES